jgi:hypothetical protein
LGFDFLKLSIQFFEYRFIESATAVANVLELPAFVLPQQQRSEMLACAFGLGITNNNRFLALDAFDLEPFTAAFAHAIRAVGIFGDNTFEMAFYCFSKKAIPLPWVCFE